MKKTLGLIGLAVVGLSAIGLCTKKYNESKNIKMIGGAKQEENKKETK